MLDTLVGHNGQRGHELVTCRCVDSTVETVAQNHVNEFLEGKRSLAVFTQVFNVDQHLGRFTLVRAGHVPLQGCG